MTPSAWPPSVFDTPVLRGLDAASRGALVAAGRIVSRAAAAPIYREGDDSDAFYVVIAGAVELRAVRRGDEQASVLRVARSGDSFGEEALLPGIPRRVTATAQGDAQLAEIPIAVFRRVTGRAVDAHAAQREWRYLQRAAARDLLACSAFARDLGADDVELLLDGMRLEQFERGARIFEPGDRATHFYFVVEGLVQLQRDDDDGKTSVSAYLARGDFFGDEEVLAEEPRQVAAVAGGDSWCAVVPREVLRSLSDRNPGLLPRLRRVVEARDAEQAEVIGAAAAQSTQHVFKDLYRMQMARSLLVIDQDSCVRCGHCAWSCSEVHGVSRLIRRGDKVVTQLGGGGGGAGGGGEAATARPATWLLPNTCQHCRNAACMVDCPTGAIGRDPQGEVFIREDLCTGCGNCAKSCPWDNIQMAPRPTPARGKSADVAVKCDLCRAYEAPACVEACPTGAVLRLDPGRDVAEVARVLNLPVASATTPRARPATARPTFAPAIVVSLACAAGLALAALAHALQRAGTLQPGRGAGLALGVVAALLVAGLAAYVVPKRLVRRRMRPRARGVLRETRPPPRSRTRGHLVAHLALGVIAPAAALGHAGLRMPASPGGALSLALAITTALGVLGALVYRLVPRALTRLERRGALPEDLASERDALQARLFREISGTSDRVKLLADRVLVPYVRAPLGWMALIASRRGIGDEARRLRARVEEVLAGRGRDVADGAEPLIAIAVELRALPARRALHALLRAWMPVHIVAAAATVALLVAHVVTAVAR